MRGSKYLVKNIGLLTIGQFGTKLLSFFLVPLYTYVLTTTEYGTYDLYSTTVSLLIPILTLNIADAALRFPLDEKCNKNDVVTVSISYFIKSVIFAIILVCINYIFNILPVLNEFAVLFLVLFAVNGLNGILVNLCRGLDLVKNVAISGVICCVVMIGMNMIFLLPLHLGLEGYFLANILGSFSQCVYLFFSARIWSYLNAKIKNEILKNKMTEYSKPLLINNISWWISSVSDRYIVTWMCGIAANGIYSVGYKIPSILNIFQTIFNQAWTLSAVQDFDSEDKSGFFSSMYNFYNFGMVSICSILIIGTKIIASILYAKDFYIAWKYVPFLLIATVFGSLSGYIGGIFAAVKDSKIFAQSSIVGAIVNIILNVLLISVIGPLGAAISTAVSYVVTWVLRMYHVRNYIKMDVNLSRDIIAYIILIIQAVLFFILNNSILLYGIQCILFIVIVLLYKNQVTIMLAKLKRQVRRKNDTREF